MLLREVPMKKRTALIEKLTSNVRCSSENIFDPKTLTCFMSLFLYDFFQIGQGDLPAFYRYGLPILICTVYHDLYQVVAG